MEEFGEETKCGNCSGVHLPDGYFLDNVDLVARVESANDLVEKTDEPTDKFVHPLIMSYARKWTAETLPMVARLGQAQEMNGEQVFSLGMEHAFEVGFSMAMALRDEERFHIDLAEPSEERMKFVRLQLEAAKAMKDIHEEGDVGNVPDFVKEFLASQGVPVDNLGAVMVAGPDGALLKGQEALDAIQEALDSGEDFSIGDVTPGKTPGFSIEQDSRKPSEPRDPHDPNSGMYL